jgi:hypothetical protein
MKGGKVHAVIGVEQASGRLNSAARRIFVASQRPNIFERATWTAQATPQVSDKPPGTTGWKPVLPARIVRFDLMESS